MDTKDTKGTKGTKDIRDTEDSSNPDSSNVINPPKKIQRALKKLAEEGEEPVLIFPGILERYTTDRMRSMVRMGMIDKIFGYLVATKKSVHFIRPGIMWDQVRTVPLEELDDIEYINEFHYNTLKMKTPIGSENIIFYDDVDGIKFYQYIKQWLKENKESKEGKSQS